ncbi:alpha/beta fold hydrolase [Aureimonas mangrovi]|uniref:alpha/beta fold hydrolase n=1 Tax=Aureimonas mangrovi TaxID=2758041 RepID=UPI00163D6570|nr:alpha/beta hydrolase [Aureimonas mangrovi]
MVWLRHQPATGEGRAVLLVFHGLAEHSGRYERFAAEMSAIGLHVYAHDHRGHGRTSAPDASPRRFAEKDGARLVVEDCRAVFDHARARHPNLPMVVLGHSMGGLIAMAFARRYGRDLAGLCVWNANFDGARLAPRLTAHLVLAVERALMGSDVPSPTLTHATFETWGRSVPGRRTEFDWLTHDEEAVDRYIVDPLCGWSPTISLFSDLVTLIAEGGRSRGLRALPSDLPLHLLCGTQDPATAGGAAVRRLADCARAVGLPVTLTVVEGARHETLHEIAPYRSAATRSFSEWMDGIAPPHHPAAGEASESSSSASPTSVVTKASSESSSGVST